MTTYHVIALNKHAPMLRYFRDFMGIPILSTWINDPGQEVTEDNARAKQAMVEATQADVTVIFRRDGETLGPAVPNIVSTAAIAGKRIRIVGAASGAHIPRAGSAIELCRCLGVAFIEATKGETRIDENTPRWE